MTDNFECSICNKVLKGTVFQCPHCGNYYCDDHYTVRRCCPYYHYRALHRNVVAVVVVALGAKTWRAYIRDVPGENHDDEWMEVVKTGAKLPYAVAVALWSNFASEYNYEWSN